MSTQIYPTNSLFEEKMRFFHDDLLAFDKWIVKKIVSQGWTGDVEKMVRGRCHDSHEYEQQRIYYLADVYDQEFKVEEKIKKDKAFQEMMAPTLEEKMEELRNLPPLPPLKRERFVPATEDEMEKEWNKVEKMWKKEDDEENKKREQEQKVLEGIVRNWAKDFRLITKIDLNADFETQWQVYLQEAQQARKNKEEYEMRKYREEQEKKRLENKQLLRERIQRRYRAKNNRPNSKGKIHQKKEEIRTTGRRATRRERIAKEVAKEMAKECVQVSPPQPKIISQLEFPELEKVDEENEENEDELTKTPKIEHLSQEKVEKIKNKLAELRKERKEKREKELREYKESREEKEKKVEEAEAKEEEDDDDFATRLASTQQGTAWVTPNKKIVKLPGEKRYNNSQRRSRKYSQGHSQGQQEWQTQKSRKPKTPSFSPPKDRFYKTSMCRYISNGRQCPHEVCRYAHNHKELRPRECHHGADCWNVKWDDAKGCCVDNKVRIGKANHPCPFFHPGMETKEQFIKRCQGQKILRLKTRSSHSSHSSRRNSYRR